MKRAALDFSRPEALAASTTPERRGLARDEVRLLVTSAEGRHRHGRFRDLAAYLEPGTLLVVNRSATLPASLPARAEGATGRFVLHLSTAYGGGVWLAEPRWSASRPGPLPLEPDTVIDLAGLEARLLHPYPGLPRLWLVRIEGDIEAAMARHGRPITYGYLRGEPPPLDAFQTLFAETPGSAEMPSAARPFTPRVLASLERRGIDLASITLHTGVSSLEVETDEVEDHALYPEPFEVSQDTADAVNAARAAGRPVIAVGTTVVRALESAWDGCALRAASGFTRLYVHPGRPVHSVDGLLTGLHDPLASHLAMLYAVAGVARVRSAYSEAVQQRYLWHELGDSHLILPSGRPDGSGAREASLTDASLPRVPAVSEVPEIGFYEGLSLGR